MPTFLPKTFNVRSKELFYVTRRKTQRTEINCFNCCHFYITYERHFPYGCRAVGFKSRRMPAHEMFLNSGLVCLLFEEKEKKSGV